MNDKQIVDDCLGYRKNKANGWFRPDKRMVLSLINSSIAHLGATGLIFCMLIIPYVLSVKLLLKAKAFVVNTMSQL